MVTAVIDSGSVPEREMRQRISDILLLFRLLHLLESFQPQVFLIVQLFVLSVEMVLDVIAICVALEFIFRAFVTTSFLY